MVSEDNVLVSDQSNRTVCPERFFEVHPLQTVASLVSTQERQTDDDTGEEISVTTATRDLVTSLLQYLLGFGALAWVLTSVEWQTALRRVETVSPNVLVLVVGASLLGILAYAFTWHVLLNEFAPVQYRDAAELSIAVLFVNQLLPSRLAGRSAAPFFIRQNDGLSSEEAVVVTTVHTVLHSVLYGVCSIVGLIAAFQYLPISLLALVAVSTALYFTPLFAVLAFVRQHRIVNYSFRGFQRLVRVLSRFSERLDGADTSLREFALEVRHALTQWESPRKSIVPYTLGWSVSQIVAAGLRLAALFVAFGGSAEYGFLLPFYLILANSVTLLPLTPGGMGVTEAVSALVFTSLGVQPDVVVPAIVLNRMLGVYLPALCGWYPATRSGFRPSVFH